MSHFEIDGMDVHNNIAGKTIAMALTDGRALILRATDGHEYRIEWRDGEPVLVGIGVRIMVPAVSVFGAVG